MKQKRSFIESAMHYHKIVLLIVGMLVLVGMYGLYIMPKQEVPAIVVREGAVVAVYPGATSEEVEERVAKPLENFVFGFQEVSKQKTYSQSKDGMAIVFLELNNNVNDKDAFWSKLKHGLPAVKTQLPAGVVAVQAIDDIGDTSSLLITLESGQKTYRELEKYLEGLEDRLRRVDAVSKLRRYGLQREQITIYLDQNKLARYGIGPLTTLAKLSAEGFTTLSGSVNNDRVNAPIHIADTYHGERDIAEQIIYSDAQGNIIRLKDVARIVREYPDSDKYIHYNGRKCVLLSVEMREGSNIVDMGHQVHHILDDYASTLPKDVHVACITDQSQVVSDSVQNFLRELLIAVVSVIVVVILLMPLRVAGVSALSIPITIFTAISLFYMFGIELNTVTLAALIVTLGMVVDDSVVIIDNYMEKLGEGMPRWQAAYAAPQEFFMSVLSATLSISVIFFPLLFTMQGTNHDFIKSFPWAMFIILSISLLVSLLVTPYLQYTFIRKGLTVSAQSAGKRKKPLDYLQAGYNRLLSFCFAHPAATLATGVLIVGVGVLLLVTTPQRIMPVAERNQFAVEFYLPDGTASKRTAAVADSMEHILRRDARVVSVTSFIGQGSPRFHAAYRPQVGGPNFAQFIVNTQGDKETEAMLDEYADRYADYFPDTYMRFKQMDYNNALYPVEVRLSGDSLRVLWQAARMVEGCMRSGGALTLIRTNYEEPLPGISVEPDEVEANRLGINKTLLSANLALHFGKGIPMTTLWEGDYPVDVVLKSDRKDGNATFDDVPEEYIPAMGGATSVPLRQIARVRPDWTAGSIIRRNGVRTLSVVAEPRRGLNANTVTADLETRLKELKLPQGVSFSIGGMTEKDAETAPMIASGVGIAIVIIFFILLFHFKKIGLAVINLTSITLCVFGAAAGLRILGLELSLTSILGIVSLMGILVRNGIIMLDYAEELRHKEGMDVRDAAYHAGVRRMRPIFLTSAAASVGVLPMILENSTLWTPMGTTIFFGTLISMVFISTILPVLYWVVFRNTKVKVDVSE